MKLSRLLLTTLVATFLSGCTLFKKRQDMGSVPPAGGTSEKVLNLYIWADYTSPQILEEFTRRTGIKVRVSNYASNEELIGKLQAGATGYDLVLPTDYMVPAMIKLGMVRELDKSKIQNLRNVDSKFLGKDYDPANKWSLPYAWTITGIGVNTAAYPDPVTSWGDLLRNDKVKDRATVLDDFREAIGAALKLNGASLNSKDPKELALAKSALIAAKPHLKAFNASPSSLLTSGEVVMAHIYSGEALVAARDSGKPIKFIIPKEGGTLAIDNIVIPKGATHIEAAYLFINYLYEPTTNADFVRRMMYGPVIIGTRALLAPELQRHPILFPQAEALSHCETMKDLGNDTSVYDRIWSEIKASSH